jgi:hypothetical protein
MPKTFELIYGYVHCSHETLFSAGFVDTEEEAAAWVRAMTAGEALSVPENDPACDCAVSFCPLKFQRPVYSYRKA